MMSQSRAEGGRPQGGAWRSETAIRGPRPERSGAGRAWLPSDPPHSAEIAGELYISMNTLKSHIKSIYRKLDASSRSDAVARARLIGFSKPSQGHVAGNHPRLGDDQVRRGPHSSSAFQAMEPAIEYAPLHTRFESLGGITLDGVMTHRKRTTY